jgi:hypothetical protein
MGQKIGKAILVDIAQPFSNRTSFLYATWYSYFSLFTHYLLHCAHSTKESNTEHVAGTHLFS